MIRQVRGVVLGLDAGSATVEVAGVGMMIYMPTSRGLTQGKESALYTHLAVKQDGLELYGFVEEADRDFFEKLLLVPGVGPKTALSILRRSPRDALMSAIARRDLNYLTRVGGLGKKSAEKLMVELSEKLSDKKSQGTGDDAEIFDTLVALGYTEREARKALSAVPESVSGKEARLRSALGSK